MRNTRAETSEASSEPCTAHRVRCIVFFISGLSDSYLVTPPGGAADLPSSTALRLGGILEARVVELRARGNAEWSGPGSSPRSSNDNNLHCQRGIVCELGADALDITYQKS